MKKVLSVAMLLASASLMQCSSEAPPLAGTLVINDTKANQLYAQALAFQQRGKLGKAIDRLEELVEEHPLATNADEAYKLLADLHWQDGEPVRSFDALNDLIVKYPASPYYQASLQRQFQLADLAAQGKLQYKFLGITSQVDKSKAIEMLGKIRENAPQSSYAPKALYTIANLQRHSSQQQKSIQSYTQLCNNYPQSSYAPPAQMAIGDTLMEIAAEGNHNKANLQKALRAYNDYLTNYPSHKDAARARSMVQVIRNQQMHNALAIADFYYKSNQPQAASFYCREVIESPNTTASAKAAAQKMLQQIKSNPNPRR